jgi:hypothetical protein
MILYYSFFMDFLLDVKDSIIGVMQDHNLTTIEIPQKVYNASAHKWVDEPKQFDLTGFVDLVMVLTIVFALYALGGFHLMRSSEEEIIEVVKELKNLGVEYVTPTHCSGDLAIEMFKEAYGENYIPGGVGRIIEF